MSQLAPRRNSATLARPGASLKVGQLGDHQRLPEALELLEGEAELADDLVEEGAIRSLGHHGLEIVTALLIG